MTPRPSVPVCCCILLLLVPIDPLRCRRWPKPAAREPRPEGKIGASFMPTHGQIWLLPHSGGPRLAAQNRQYFPGDVARVGLGGEEDECGRDLFGLAGAPHRRIGAVFARVLSRVLND